MWQSYRHIIKKYPKITLVEERRLIAKAKRGCKSSADEIVLRHLGFVMFRLRSRILPGLLYRYGEDFLSEALPLLYQKIEQYNLRYRDKKGRFKPVRFSSYVWKRVDGFIIDSIKKETWIEKMEVPHAD